MILSERRAIFIIFTAIFIYVSVIGAVSVLRHYNFETQAWDMGIFTQTLWNASKGRWMTNSIEETPNHFGVHMSPILFLLLPGFLIFPSAYYLLILQALALAFGAWPLYLFAKKVLGRHDFALLISVGYLLYPSLHFVNLFDFHPVAFLVPALLFAFYFFAVRKWIWFWFFMIIAASAQEDAILAVMFSCVFLAIIYWREAKEKKIGLWTAVAALIYFIIATKVLMPYFGGGLLRLDRYAHLGGSFAEITRNLLSGPSLFFKTAFSAPKLAYLFWLFLPTAFLPFLYPLSLFILVPGLLENLLTNFENQFSGFYQYDSMLIAGVFIAGVYGLQKLLRIFPYGVSWIKGFLVTAVLAGFLLRSPVSPFLFPTDLFRTNERAYALREIVKNVPEEASVTAHTNIVPHLAKRERVYMLGTEPFWVNQKMFKPDVVVVDGGDLFGFYTPDSLQRYVDSYAESEEYSMKIIKERYFVFTKKSTFENGAIAPSRNFQE
ncbi:MAG: hypothetical protein A2931_03425 [Candidatus Niyogibacteria bacterium RIFCSPLOWO2_01_FULL_45_48]|uniref:DUF2079 domain-containing protein n=2 Tax=Candidatus Niyogiibacteriota TaxID=1817912 RepID=A0A1G2EZR0_9BACT|nr:MAG: hypothetical protein A2835_02140 [Candidatus Niyogibacteria bacterium RIFCSPHIGHO2_01_FULL_45_28]OGZ31029.1 MAG: hypothetical protein A2931_03425 [Candidatus Niyogibacteria bacterium RIFCSPLOWO2_01_FULL_45_48]OGZ31324.1 MAG: hypothetical protein A3J00_03005 [Candidatus Niyogibacteria bacterium RIFCSPLOWO2_02_FULL_45_13]